jgi:hypothetical protein
MKIVEELWNQKEAINFHYPVDWKNLKLDNYPLLIKNPMDLSSIKKKIKNNKYRNINEFLNDI